MNCEGTWLLLLAAPALAWMMFHSRFVSCRFSPWLINVLRTALLLSALSLPGSVLRESRGIAHALRDALNSLSEEHLRKCAFSSLAPAVE
jgi:hypothetical protein